jgi:hypothetical protein
MFTEMRKAIKDESTSTNESNEKSKINKSFRFKLPTANIDSKDQAKFPQKTDAKD